MATSRTVPPARARSSSVETHSNAPSRFTPMIRTLRRARATSMSMRSNELRGRRTSPAATGPVVLLASASSRRSIRFSRPVRSTRASMPRKPKNPRTISRSVIATPKIVGSKVMSTAAAIKTTGTTASSPSMPRSRSLIRRSPNTRRQTCPAREARNFYHCSGRACHGNNRLCVSARMQRSPRAEFVWLCRVPQGSG